jgi:hypothetical protein
VSASARGIARLMADPSPEEIEGQDVLIDEDLRRLLAGASDPTVRGLSLDDPQLDLWRVFMTTVAR